MPLRRCGGFLACIDSGMSCGGRCYSNKSFSTAAGTATTTERSCCRHRQRHRDCVVIAASNGCGCNRCRVRAAVAHELQRVPCKERIVITAVAQSRSAIRVAGDSNQRHDIGIVVRIVVITFIAFCEQWATRDDENSTSSISRTATLICFRCCSRQGRCSCTASSVGIEGLGESSLDQQTWCMFYF